MEPIRYSPCGDSAMSITWADDLTSGAGPWVRAARDRLRAAAIDGVAELLPTYTSLLVTYDPMVVGFDELLDKVTPLMAGLEAVGAAVRTVVRIPVCYDLDLGPDLPDVAAHAGLTVDEVIAIHSGVDYPIAMLGFLPGFAYLEGLDARLHTPRLAEPRVRIEAGSVGIGGAQTGVYPIASPGGWRIIGRTPLPLFDPASERPIHYEAGECMRFDPIDRATFDVLAVQVEAGSFDWDRCRGCGPWDA